MVFKALEKDFLITQINTHDGLNVDHITQFYKLWEMLQNTHLSNDVPDSIIWKLANNGCYSARSAYTMQFHGLIFSTMPKLVWKPWASPKCKIVAWFSKIGYGRRIGSKKGVAKLWAMQPL
jgi:hypothetical protein